MNILTLNLVFSTLVFWIAARRYVLPHLGEWRAETLLLPILLLHSFRHLGMMFLAPGAIYPGLPQPFAVPAAYGDLLTALLAMSAILTGFPRWLVWLFGIVGSVDLVAAITLATLHGASDFMGAAYWIPAFWVPALLVTHCLVFVILNRELSGVTKSA